MTPLGYLLQIGSAAGFMLTALAVVCVTVTIVLLLTERAAGAQGGRRAFWAALAAVVTGSGVWTTHFVAMIGYRPDLILGFDPATAAASALIATILVGGPLAAIGYVAAPLGRSLIGGLAGLGMAVLHFRGMEALDVCVANADAPASVAAFAVGTLAFVMAARIWTPGRPNLPTGALLVTGVCALHAMALSGITLARTQVFFAAQVNQAILMALLAVAAIVLCIVAFTAVTASRRLQEQWRTSAAALAEQHDVLTLALNNMTNGLALIDAAGRIVLHNSRLIDMFRPARTDGWAGTPLADFLRDAAQRAGLPEGPTVALLSDFAERIRSDAPRETEDHIGDSLILKTTCQPLPGGGALLTVLDVTQSHRAQTALTHMAYHDALTGLPNRRNFHECIERGLAEGTTRIAMMLDLDRFKKVNDTLGHPVGDLLLVDVGRRLRESCRPEDKVFRLGGDELAVLPEGNSDAAAMALGARIVAAIERPFQIGEHTISIGCSVGVARAPGRATNPDRLIQMADMALYRAKSLGRGRVERYEKGMVEYAAARRQTEIDMARAVKSGEFELEFQPIFSLPERRLSGFEALIRWDHPTRGRIAPGEFIALAEENGMIADIGAFVLDEACRAAARWPSDIHVAVNVSSAQLATGNLPHVVTNTLARHGVAADRLELELTETTMLHDDEAVASVLKALRARGLRIAMDDFGASLSSLGYLRSFAIDRIKIDRRFVGAAPDDVEARAVLRAVTGMARDLSIRTLGEGVETEDQLARLVALGCGAAQGFFLGGPMPLAEANRLIGLRMFETDREADAEPEGPIRPASKTA